MVNWDNKYFRNGIIIVTFLIILVILIELYFPEVRIVQTIMAVFIGSFITMFSTLALEENKSRRYKEELRSLIRNTLAHNLASAKCSIEALEIEINNIKNGIYLFEELELPLFPIKTGLWDLISKQETEEALKGKFKNLVNIIHAFERLENYQRIRENLIIYKYGDSMAQIKKMDNKIIYEIKNIDNLMKKTFDIELEHVK